MTPANSDHASEQAAVTTWADLNENEKLTLQSLFGALSNPMLDDGWITPYDATEHRSLLGLWGKELVDKDKNTSTWRITDAGCNLLASAPVSTSARAATLDSSLDSLHETLPRLRQSTQKLLEIVEEEKGSDASAPASDEGRTGEDSDMPTVTISLYTYQDLCKIRNDVEDMRQQLADAKAANGALRYTLTWIRDYTGSDEIYQQATAALETTDGSASAASADDDFAAGFADGVTTALTNKGDAEQ